MKKQQSAPYIITFTLFVSLVIGLYTHRDAIISTAKVAKANVETKAPQNKIAPLASSADFSRAN